MPKGDWLNSAPKRLPVYEQHKAARFENTKLGDWWAYVHFAMRNILGESAGCEGNKLIFEHSQNDKPRLAAKHKSDIRFNLSHCSNVALLALTQNTEVGIDIEIVKEIPDMNLVASHFFSSEEQDYLKTFSGRQKYEVFYEIWTQKESLIKANGQGLSIPLEVFNVMGVNAKNWTNINPASPHFASAKYMTKALSLSEFGIGASHRAAISIDNSYESELPIIKMCHFKPDQIKLSS